MTPTSGEHGIIAARLHVELGYYVRKNRLGDTYIAEAAFVIDPSGDVGAPDIGFVTAARAVPAGRGPVPIPPDLTVEVISPSDVLVKVAAKVQAYLEARGRRAPHLGGKPAQPDRARLPSGHGWLRHLGRVGSSGRRGCRARFLATQRLALCVA